MILLATGLHLLRKSDFIHQFNPLLNNSLEFLSFSLNFCQMAGNYRSISALTVLNPEAQTVKKIQVLRRRKLFVPDDAAQLGRGVYLENGIILYNNIFDI